MSRVFRSLFQPALSDGREMTAVDPATILSNASPKNEVTGAAPGAAPMASRDDHQHPRVTSVVVASVASGNTVAIQFTRAFASEPGIDYQELPPSPNTTAPVSGDTDANTQPTSCKVIAWTKGPTALLPGAGAGEFTGCTVRVWRAQTIPTNLVTLLLGGVFNLFAASVVGTRFSLIAVARSDV